MQHTNASIYEGIYEWSFGTTQLRAVRLDNSGRYAIYELLDNAYIHIAQIRIDDNTKDFDKFVSQVMEEIGEMLCEDN